MQTKFIELKSANSKWTHHVNPIMICNILDCGTYSKISTMGGQFIEVKETPQEIKKLIEESEKFTLITKYEI